VDRHRPVPCLRPFGDARPPASGRVPGSPVPGYRRSLAAQLQPAEFLAIGRCGCCGGGGGLQWGGRSGGPVPYRILAVRRNRRGLSPRQPFWRTVLVRELVSGGGGRCLRPLRPVLWTLQRGLGANRPSDENPSPRWRPFSDDNSASGHAFIAAVPWLNLARRAPGPGNKWLARCGSVLTGWSRINDRKHYLSQVVLGWTIAWNATEAVHAGELPAEETDLSKGTS